MNALTELRSKDIENIKDLVGSPAEFMSTIKGIVTQQVKSEFKRELRPLVEASVNNSISKLSDSVMNSSDDTLKKVLKHSISEMVATKSKDIDTKLNIFKEKIENMEGVSSPHYFAGQVQELSDRQYLQHADVSVMKNKFERMQGQLDELSVEEVTNEELISLYNKSGVQLKVICDHFNVSMSSASNWVNGKVLNPKSRYTLKMYFKRIISENREN